MNAAVVLLLLAAISVNAQIQVCQNTRPGKVPAAGIKMSATAYSNSYSSLSVYWPRPYDTNPPSCITDYFVEVWARDGRKVQQGTVSGISPAHSGASFTANGLSPGQPYQFTITAKGPGGTGDTDIRSTPFTTASAPTPSCSQPQMVSNIHRETAYQSGVNWAMVIAWDPPSGTPAECIKEYVITVYPAGSQTAIKTYTTQWTKYTDNIYQAGMAYEFYIYARNPNLGASGNGIGLRSQPIYVPSGATPLR